MFIPFESEQSSFLTGYFVLSMFEYRTYKLQNAMLSNLALYFISPFCLIRDTLEY